jgi:transcription elongation factor Elf1
VYPGGPVIYDSFDHNPNPPATGGPAYTRVDPVCPVCGHGEFVSSDEGVPHEFDTHYVSVTCGQCRTSLTIEYRAIDLSWYDGQDGQHSAVSQGRISPTDTGYNQPESYPPLPDADVFDRIDWPLECEMCDERLTGNDMLTGPGTSGSAPPDSEDGEGANFRCPHCDHVTQAGTPTDDSPA